MSYYQHLGVFSDIVSAAQTRQPLWPSLAPGPDAQQRILELLGFGNGAEVPQDVAVEQRWQHDGLEGEVVSWSVGYGPRTAAWVFKPAGVTGPLPGVLALHDHGGFKFYGKEKIADGPEPHAVQLKAFRDTCYGGRAYVNELARAGFVVLVHDTFLWGSRQFPLEAMPEWVLSEARTLHNAEPDQSVPETIALYNAAASVHEHTVAKYCNLLGSSLAGVVSYEDRVALNYLCGRPDVQASRLGCIGLSGGGNRAALLQATHPGLAAAVIVGLMSTYEGLLDHNISHTWMLFPFGLSRFADWPDLAACRAPTPLLVQYDLEDALFTEAGMRAAHAKIAAHYQAMGQPEAYQGEFYPGPHKFDCAMQEAAFIWLQRQLSGRAV